MARRIQIVRPAGELDNDGSGGFMDIVQVLTFLLRAFLLLALYFWLMK